MIFKCKMCGGTIEFNQGDSVGTCDSCGTTQTLPKIDDDRRANLYDRANHFRRNNEFDKAEGIYEQILNEDNTDAEAYWSLVLCRYGIEYVEDPSTRRRIPTVNRAQFTSVFDDANYQAALQYADGAQREVYQQEAAAINEIQKGILEISSKEEPFDVFICYKETDSSGRRTPDSVLANDLYHQLTQEGFKVFFARITLEDKLGSAYEPYIFAALNSSRVMVVLGTKPEYFNAVWVKNEWSRYLALIKSGAKKMLIPAYRDMDPYDLPEEFSHLQAQDMTKLGFMQDLIRGIKKITASDEPKTVRQETVVVNTGNASAAPLLKRAFMFLEDGDFEKADEFCEQVLNLDPENAYAYLGKLMAELNVKTQEELKNCQQPFDDRNNYSKAFRFADENLKNELTGYNNFIRERNENARKENVYVNACNLIVRATTEAECIKAKNDFESISGYRNSEEKAIECANQAEECHKDEIYRNADNFVKSGTVESLNKAIIEFGKIEGWKDSTERTEHCRARLSELEEKFKAEEERRFAAKKAAKITKKITEIILGVIAVCAAGGIIANNVIIPNIKYNNANLLLKNGSYEEAMNAYIELGTYKDAKQKASESGIEALKLGKFEKGDVIAFGQYFWRVLDIKDNFAFIVTEDCIDEKVYNSELCDVTWTNCTLVRYLNNIFYNTFSDIEKAVISEAKVKNDDNSEYVINGGNDTTDKIFLLSIDEVEKYFSNDNDRIVKYGDSSNWWWLRSPGLDQSHAAYVSSDGVVNTRGNIVSSKGGIRPALYLEF